MILCISVLSVVISPFSFLLLLIWFFSLCFLISLANGLSILFNFSKNQFLVLLILVSFVSFAFISALIFKISFLLLTLGFLISSFSSYFRCRVRLFIWVFSCFLWYACIAMNLPLSTAFIVSHRFGVVVFSFSFISMHILIYFDFFCDLLVIQQRVVQPPYVGIFNSFSPVIEI